MEQVLTQIWIAAYLGVVAYFLLKAAKNRKQAQAANLPFSFGEALLKDWLDFVISAIAMYLFLSNGGSSITIPGLSLDFSSQLAAFGTGIVTPYVVVNYVMGLISTIPGLDVGDKARKEITQVVDEKTNLADGKVSEPKYN